MLAIGVWATLAPYAGPPLGLEVNVEPKIEVVDHVVPGVVVLAVAGFAAVVGLALPLTLLAALAGLWMTATHIPLLMQVRTGEVDLAAALFHSVPGIAIFVFAVAATVVAWNETPEGGPAR